MASLVQLLSIEHKDGLSRLCSMMGTKTRLLIVLSSKKKDLQPLVCVSVLSGLLLFCFVVTFTFCEKNLIDRGFQLNHANVMWDFHPTTRKSLVKQI